MRVRVPLSPHLLENALSGKRSKKLRQLSKMAKAPTTQHLINTKTGVIVLGKCDRLAYKKLKKLGAGLDIAGTARRIAAARAVAV